MFQPSGFYYMVGSPNKIRGIFLNQGISEGLGLVPSYGSFRKLGVPYFGVLVIKNLLFRVLYLGPLFSETPTP